MQFTVAPASAPSPKPARAPRVPLAALRPSSRGWFRVTADGKWILERGEDAGTTWSVAHLPDKTVVCDYLGSLRQCRAYIGSGDAQRDFDLITAHDRAEHKASRVGDCPACDRKAA